MVIDKLQIQGGKGATTFESEVAFTSTVYFLFFSWLWISLNTTSFFFVPATVIAYRRQMNKGHYIIRKIFTPKTQKYTNKEIHVLDTTLHQCERSHMQH
jgi:hypothetical protein